MAKVIVDTTSLDKMVGKLRAISSMFPGGAGGLSSTFKSALDAVGAKILKDVITETPVSDPIRPDFHENSQFHRDKTHLKDSWRWKLKIQGSVVEGFAHVTHGKLDDLIDLLEAGSPRHSIEAKPGSVLRFYVRKGGSWEMVYSKFVVDHPGFSANKFTERAQHKVGIHVKELVSVMQSDINRIILGK
jgi:hypothetical protein